MPSFEFNDPYTKRVLPDDYVSPGWETEEVVVTSTSSASVSALEVDND
jgi:hypothetical protein